MPEINLSDIAIYSEGWKIALLMAALREAATRWRARIAQLGLAGGEETAATAAVSGGGFGDFGVLRGSVVFSAVFFIVY
jgi:hypothetical protein